MSDVTQADVARQACRDAAADLWEQLNLPGSAFNAPLMRDGTGDNGIAVQAFVAVWETAYASGVAAERERCAGIADKVAAEFTNITKDSGPAIGAVTIAVHIAAQIRAAIAAAGGEGLWIL